MMGIIFNIAIFMFDILGVFVNYKSGNYIWSVVLGICSGAIFTNIIWLIRDEVEE